MWKTIIGHASQIDRLKRALTSQRLPNAWLFSGIKGIGKRRVADVLALAMSCPNAPANNYTACNACPACHKVTAGNHPDVFIVQPESEQPLQSQKTRDDKKKPSEEIKVDQMRALQEKLQFHPLEAPGKLAIIDEADRMNAATANSLLKILEEPPSATHFVLISANPGSLLPTIRSRSQRIDFAPLPPEVINERLIQEKAMAPEDAARIARLSGGSLGMALALESDFISSTMGRFVVLASRATSADIIQAAEEWSHADPKQARLIFDLLASFYRDILRYHATHNPQELIHTEAVAAATNTPPSRAERALSDISAARRAMETTANKQLMFEHLLFSLAR